MGSALLTAVATAGHPNTCFRSEFAIGAFGAYSIAHADEQ